MPKGKSGKSGEEKPKKSAARKTEPKSAESTNSDKSSDPKSSDSKSSASSIPVIDSSMDKEHLEPQKFVAAGGSDPEDEDEPRSV